MRPLFTRLEQIAFVVRDLYAAMDLFCARGVGPWELMRFGDAGDGNTNIVSIENVSLRGRGTGTYAILQGHCVLPGSGVELELIQPLCGESIFAEFLEKYGPGVQHLSIAHGDFDESIARLRGAGYDCTQVATVDAIETCVFSDHRDLLGTDLELHKRPPDFVVPELENECWPPSGELAVPAPDWAAPPVLTIGTPDPEGARRLLEEAYGIGPWQDFQCGALNVRLSLVPAGEARILGAKLTRDGTAPCGVLGAEI